MLIYWIRSLENHSVLVSVALIQCELFFYIRKNSKSDIIFI